MRAFLQFYLLEMPWPHTHATRKRYIPVVAAVIICLTHRVSNAHLGVIAAVAALYVAARPRLAPVDIQAHIMNVTMMPAASVHAVAV